MKGPLGFLASLPSYGDVVQVGWGRWSAYVVCRPDLVWEIAVNDRTFDKGGPLYEQLRAFLGNGLATCSHQEHRVQRRQMQPAFQRDRMPGYARMMSDFVDTTTGAAWHDGQVIDPAKEMFAVFASISAASFFGTSLDQAELSRIHRAVSVLMKEGARRMFDPTGLLSKLPTARNRAYDRAVSNLSVTVRRTIQESRLRGARREDLLSVLVHTHGEETSVAWTDEELSAQVIVLMVAAFESTATTLTWACHLLARHPHIQEQLHAEARAVLGGRPAAFDDLSRLELTHRILLEVLRLYPVTWILTRTTTKDTELAGCRLPQGSTVVISPYIAHRDPDLFSLPDVFDPDRWLMPTTPRRPRDGFLPFGAGARQCIGADFALAEAAIALATLADRWRLTAPPGTRAIRPRLHITLTPSPGRVALQHRPPEAT
ncbi:cytochrome P450 [Streptomyces klenkii]